jgi:hypothetical protein
MKTLVLKRNSLKLFFLISFFVSSLTFSQNIGSSAYIDVNDIYLPFSNKGVIADVNIAPNGSGGQFAGGVFLFSSGFWLSGYTGDTLWANGAASASLIEDYLAGTVGMDPNDPKASIYKVTSSDIPFGTSWQDWSDAVDLGASFYDGNGDGIYNPVDLNGNSQWDPDEDMPDLLLDETYWCVYNDALPANIRRWGAEPQGIEVRQTIFASASAGALSNVVFVRYRIKNTGTVADTLKDVYFSQWADADVGDASDDLSGCDTVRQGTYFYNNVPDQVYGDEVPSFMMDMLTGPRSYIPGVTFIDVNGNNIYENGIDTPLDTAVNYLGINGIRIYPGAKNIELSSAITSFKNTPGYSDPDDKDQVRNYMLGLTELGLLLDPCTFAFGEVKGGVDCNLVDPIFWFSGDPVTDVGWICSQNGDLRGAGTVGPFTLVKDQEVEILIGYEVDRGTTPLGGITAVRSVSDEIQNFYENNFGYTIVSVELISFTAEPEGNSVLLRWQTSTETNNQGFEIEKASSSPTSAPGGTSPVHGWERIGFVEGHGTTTEPQIYSFYDDIDGINSPSFTYRLKQLDYDGSFEYSKEVIVELSTVPDKYSLSQNHPNPFNPSTKIKFVIPSVIASEAKQSKLVSLKVYDVLGNEVATLVNEELSPGEYEVTFNSRSGEARNLTSGIYFYTLKTGSFAQTKKMILLK